MAASNCALSMDKTDVRVLEPHARHEGYCTTSKDDKSSAKCRGANERQKLDVELTSLMKIIREKEASLKERMNDGDVLQSRLKDIRQEKEATINKRKVIDDDLKTLNNEKTGETFIKLRGSLQYRTEKALNEAISRLEVQLSTHNYRVSEEKKIVQEIDRLKRSKKILKEYLSLEEELNNMKIKQRTMRTQRDGLYRQVTLLKADEDEIKKSSSENRNQIDQLRKDLDELHDRKRKVMGELKQATQPMLHLKELQQKRVQNSRRKDNNNGAQSHSFRDSKCSPQDGTSCRKLRKDGKFMDMLLEKETLCNTLMAYLHRLTASPSITPSTPVVEHFPPVGVPVTEIQDGDMVLVLKKRYDEDDDFVTQKCGRSLKKNKKDRKRGQQNRLLCHTPDMLDQFFKLGISPPSSLNDVPFCLEALTSKKEHLQSAKEITASSAESPLTDASQASPVESLVNADPKVEGTCNSMEKEEISSVVDMSPSSPVESLVNSDPKVESTCDSMEKGEICSVADICPSTGDNISIAEEKEFNCDTRVWSGIAEMSKFDIQYEQPESEKALVGEVITTSQDFMYKIASLAISDMPSCSQILDGTVLNSHAKLTDSAKGEFVERNLTLCIEENGNGGRHTMDSKDDFCDPGSGLKITESNKGKIGEEMNNSGHVALMKAQSEVLANGVCNGDATKLDDRLNGNQDSDNSIVYSI